MFPYAQFILCLSFTALFCHIYTCIFFISCICFSVQIDGIYIELEMVYCILACVFVYFFMKTKLRHCDILVVVSFIVCLPSNVSSDDVLHLCLYSSVCSLCYIFPTKRETFTFLVTGDSLIVTDNKKVVDITTDPQTINC